MSGPTADAPTILDLVCALTIPAESEIVPSQVADKIEITGLATDSRSVRPGQLFIGMPGTQVDGGKYWSQASENGAIAAFVSTDVLNEVNPAAAAIPLWGWPAAQLPAVCGQVAARYYNYPGRKLSLVGVTGTNGKTTTTHLIEHLLGAAGEAIALVGTLYNRWPGHSQTSAHTTPFATELQRTLAAAREAGSQRAVLEVSSHSLAQQRVWGCQFDAAVWTNLTQDHLDFHATMDEYWQAKALLFRPDYLKPNGRAIVNRDDEGGQRLLEVLKANNRLAPWSFTLRDASTWPERDRSHLLWASHVDMQADGLRATLHTPTGSTEVSAPLVGQFNLANLLAAVGVAVHLGVPLATIRDALPRFPGVPGRVTSVRIPDGGQDIAAIVDYAHTPDGLENLLAALRPSVRGELVCVFGCGGDRDRAKRPLMGEIAARLADRVVVTSDNPRTEEPQQILDDILAGMKTSATPMVVEVDRKLAIQHAIAAANPGDTVAIAGKGHEDYQILGKVKVHFDDSEVAAAALRQRVRAAD
ncbi:MAG: UDP-N-acetylmuramoyl-L-alanyl-D-glutamate--2,6-diaminopimelate ligase [Cyanobacteria bacterium J06642_2]